MPPRGKPSSSHSSRPSSHRPSSSHSSSRSSHSSRSSRSSHSSHRSSYSSHHSSYHRPYHSGYSRPSGGGLFSGLLFGSLFSQRSDAQERGTTVINQQIVNAPPAPKMYECPYCLGKVTAQASADGLQSLICPNCGGVLQESNAIAQQQPAQSFSQPQGYMSAPDTGYDTEQPAAGRRRKSVLGKVIGLVLVICFFAAAVRIANSRITEIAQHNYNNNNYNYNDDYNGYGDDYDYNEPDNSDSIYVDALGRTVWWDSGYDCYYDEDTDCYFFLNNDMDPPVWQYWFEGVSSNYGSDYGWMEWDYDENRWYVQQSENSWVPLPENEYTDHLWHMD